MTGRGLVPGLPTPHPLASLLPALMQDDDVSVRWVSGLDDVLAPVHSTLDNLEAYLDPRTAPEDWLSWLSQWVGLPTELDLGVTNRRRAIAHAGDLFPRRGTVGGLAELVSTALDVTVEVSDTGGATWSAVPGSDLPGDPEPCVRVRVTDAGTAGSTPDVLRTLLQDAVPAHVRLELDLGPLTTPDSGELS